MSAYVIGEVEVSDERREDFENIFLAQAHKELEEVNAKIVDGGLNNAAALIGLPPKNRFVVIQSRTSKHCKNGGMDRPVPSCAKNSKRTAMQAGA